MKINKRMGDFSPPLQGGVVPLVLSKVEGKERRGYFVLFKLLCIAIFLSMLTTTLLFFGCSARKARPTQLRVHPVDWVAAHPGFIYSNALQTEYGAACQSCHGVDYSGGISDVSCTGCHNTVRPQICSRCHGDSTRDLTGSPPKALNGGTLDTARGVGGHLAMVKGGTLFAGTDCQTCHIKPDFVLTASHFTPSGAGVDGRAEVVFSGTARLFSSRYGSPVFNVSNGTCSNVYCHGAFPGGDTTKVVDFYKGPAESSCGSCHAVDSNFASLSGRHKTHNPDSLDIQCITCHFATVDSFNSIQPASRLQKHVNGIFDVAFDPAVDTLGIGLFDGVSCRGMPDRTLTGGCHANKEDW